MSYFQDLEAHGGLDPTAEQPDDDEREAYLESTFPCGCGDEGCRGLNDDPGNFRINGTLYAAECPMGRQLDQIAEGRNRAARADVDRDETFIRR